MALALREFPNLNAKLDAENQAVVQFGHVNIGVAVAVEDGLLTVVCHDADLKSIHQISNEVATMASRAREGKVRSEDIEGSTFSVSNVGPSRTLTIISLVFNVSYFFNEVLKKVKSTELIGYLPWNCGTKV